MALKRAGLGGVRQYNAAYNSNNSSSSNTRAHGFPPPGVVGIAGRGTACSPYATPLVYDPTSSPAAIGAFPRTSDGNVAVAFGSEPGASCPDDSAACTASASLSSRTEDVWLTMAHELGHNLGEGHSFDEG